MSEIKKKKFGPGDLIILFVFAILVTIMIVYAFGGANRVQKITQDTFEEYIYSVDANGNIVLNPNTVVNEVYFETTSHGNILNVSGSYKSEYAKDTGYQTFTTKVTWESYEIINHLAKDPNASFKITELAIPVSFPWLSVISIVVMVIIAIIVVSSIMKANKGNNQAFDFGRSRARLSRKSGVTFKDVAGLDEEKEEMVEVVDFLKSPKKYFDMGARIPKGILLVGSPGTGKTLLARAVAGEANVPFYTISGSDFVEMFVGVGASRVRDMFKIAKQNAPCIIFIDEIDAVGRQRGAGLGGGHDEREQTLNQLLVEMDGFAGNSGIIVMAATNRADILDPALLRPGRFDRQITIHLPDVRAREAILKVHARNKRISQRVNFAEVARQTPGFSGADLENLLNEAALLAARENCREIKIYHISEAIDRVIMGPAKKSRKYSEREKALTAYHEAGHAVIGIKLKHAHKVQKVTIIPRGRAGGYNLMTPEEETFNSTKKELMAEITSFLAGRIAEELVFNEMTTGAYADFQSATAIARAMVTEYGMSSLGPIQYESNRGNVFLGRDYMKDKNFSDQVALEIDEEVRKIINECYNLGKQTLEENRALLDTIAKHLVEVETLTKEDIDELVNTGQLSWWEKKKAKMAEEAAIEAAETNSEQSSAEEVISEPVEVLEETTTESEDK